MYAVDDLSDAIDVTRDFLTPVRAWMWLKLAIVVFFVGGVGGNFPSFSGGGGGGETPPPDFAGEPSIPPDVWALLITAVVVILLVVLFFMAIGAIMEFVLVESLRTGEVHVRRYGKSNLGEAISLLLFRIALGLATVLAVGLPVAAVYFAAPAFEAFTLGVIALLALFAIGVFVVQSVISSLTTNFVVPVMLLESCGAVEGWRRFWPTLTGEWKEYAVYYLLLILVGLVVGIGVGFISLLVAIPFGLVAIVLAITVIGLIFLPVIAIAFFLIVSLIQVPVVSYFRYYSLLVLGDTNADLDLIPDQRAAVRSDGGFDGQDGPDGDRREESTWGGTDRDGSSWDSTDSSDRERESNDRNGDSTDDAGGRDGGSSGWDDGSTGRDEDGRDGDDDRDDRY